MSPHERPPSHELSFPTTRWTLVDALAQRDSSPRGNDWNQFVGLYAPVLVVSLERKGASRADAEDIVQGLLAKLWQSDAFPGVLHEHHGRLRTYLMSCLKNLWIDAMKKNTRQKRGGGAEVVVLSELETCDPEDEAVFDQEWAKAVVLRACERLRAEYTMRGQGLFFEEGWCLLQDDGDERRATVGEELDMKANTLAVGLKRLRERLSQTVRDEVASALYQPDEEAVNGEIKHLLRALSMAGGLPSLTPCHREAQIPLNGDDGQ